MPIYNRNDKEKKNLYLVVGGEGLEFGEVNTMRKEYAIPACSGMKIDIRQGQSITVIDIEGGQVVDFFAEVSGNV